MYHVDLSFASPPPLAYRWCRRRCSRWTTSADISLCSSLHASPSPSFASPPSLPAGGASLPAADGPSVRQRAGGAEQQGRPRHGHVHTGVESVGKCGSGAWVGRFRPSCPARHIPFSRSVASTLVWPPCFAASSHVHQPFRHSYSLRTCTSSFTHVPFTLSPLHPKWQSAATLPTSCMHRSHHPRSSPHLSSHLQAYSALSEDQRRAIRRHVADIVHAPIDTLEKVGGGGVRCTLAEYF